MIPQWRDNEEKLERKAKRDCSVNAAREEGRNRGGERGWGWAGVRDALQGKSNPD